MRYTLSNEEHAFSTSFYRLLDRGHPVDAWAIPDTRLYRLLDRGRPIDAWATPDVSISDDVTLRGESAPNGNHRGLGGVVLKDAAVVNGRAVLSGRVLVVGSTVRGGSVVRDRAVITGGAFIDTSVVYGSAQVDGAAVIRAEVPGGVLRPGWLSPIIQGSRHIVNSPDGIHIRVGCAEFTPNTWLRHYEALGTENGYTPEQRKEYHMYLKLLSTMIRMRREGTRDRGTVEVGPV